MQHFVFRDWDSVHFGLRIGRVIPTRFGEELSKEALAWAKSSSIDCMYLLVDSNDPASIRTAAESGWRMVDVRVTLSAKLSEVARGPGLMREARGEDIPYLKHLAERSHKDSRFYADGSFPQEACDRLFAIWIERSVREREFAGAVFVPELDRSPAGYITCAIKDGVGKIGLIAVDERARRTGLGTRLLAESARWFQDQGAERVSVVTQGCNIPALRMYARFRLNVESIQLWFHWWRKD